MSYADKVFKETIKRILEEGVSDEGMDVRTRWEDGTPAHTIGIFGVSNRYDLSKEFPILTIRRTFWKSAWDEMLWIWQRKSNNIKDLGPKGIWQAWADESGSIGKAYGYQMGVLHKYKDITPEGLKKAFGDDLHNRTITLAEDGLYCLDQTDWLIYQLVNNPASRRHHVTYWQPDDMHAMSLAPCAHSITFCVLGNKLNATLTQRSQDMLAASNWNCVQYALLVYSLAAAYGFEPGELVHNISHCHLYIGNESNPGHIEIAKELLEKEEFEAPKLWIDPEVKSFYDFTKDSFKLEDYKYNEFNHKIPIAI